MEQTQVQSTTSSLDPQAVMLAKAIRQAESGGNFTAPGKSGEYGAYQYTEPTWQKDSMAAGINVPLQQATPQQQNQVAYTKIKSLKDKGYNIGQIASSWNAGEGEPNAYTGKFSNGSASTGTNKYGVKFDVPAYAKSVANAYQTIKNGGEVKSDPYNPSSVSSPQFPLASQKNSPEAAATPNSGVLGTNPNDSLYGKVIDNSLTRGLINLVPGASTIGQSLGTGIGQAAEKIKGLLGGKDNSATYDTSQPSTKDQLVAGGKLLGTVGAVASGGELLGGDILTSGPLAKASIKSILKGAVNDGETLTREGAITRLTAKLANMSIDDIGGRTEKDIVSALKYLNMNGQETQGVIKTLLKGGLSLAAQTALVNALGSQVGNLVHGAITK